MGGSSSSPSTTVKRLLPIAAAPAAMAGLAAAFALGNGSSAPAATADIAEHHSATTDPQTHVSAAQPVVITKQTATGLPVARLDASRLAAIQPKGKHHRTLPTKYVVQSGDTLASIAKHLYSSPDYWTVLYWANHAQVKYANEIHVGQTLTVPAKPAKIPSAPKTVAPAPPPTTTTVSTGGSSSGTSRSSVSTAAAPAAAAPAQTQSTSTGATSSFQACVIARESGGNPQVMNASGHYGLYQFSAATWAAYGGNPADFGNASVAEQNRVFNNAIAAGGESNWAPYDGC